MGVRLERTDLPGIGVRHELVTSSGERVGIVAHHDGRRDVVVFDKEDPDACLYSIQLADDEAAALADILGTSIMLSQLSEVGSHAHGLLTEQLTIPADSPYVDRPLGETRARVRTGASVVAILRDQDVITSPGIDVTLRQSDIIVAVGTRHNLDQLASLFAGTSE
ncbi:potassium transporter TrkA [Actinobacteria bacterium YIM 96077]|uniref:Potassium transporter TrkA n=1 Tax=Phytoactinopolyspora halophila TaxID=1981511 RepID=A0A329R4U5_9ACTN|nr:cation:proton antiporter regulatory subunit [Phytoactinopolyspora halophila]AYY12170.1 potassium transporter TrkA [Actinobacteria bacterium YIM 96077]RAW18936.1 potassium transporter TrkA [Phytoactinopolyspora halophila]